MDRYLVLVFDFLFMEHPWLLPCLGVWCFVGVILYYKIESSLSLMKSMLMRHTSWGKHTIVTLACGPVMWIVVGFGFINDRVIHPVMWNMEDGISCASEVFLRWLSRKP